MNSLFLILENGEKAPEWVFIIVIIVGALCVISFLAWFIMFMFCNKWIRVGNKAVRAVRFGKKDGKILLRDISWEKQYRDESEIYNSKKEALEAKIEDKSLI